jgi:hypothetical protein
VGLGAAGLWHATGYSESFNSEPPRAIRTEPPRALPPPIGHGVHRLVLFVVDGMGESYASHLGLGPWEMRAARATLEVPWPSYSRSGYSVIGTGAPPAWSGVHNNDYEGPVRLDHVFWRAREAGHRVRAVLDNQGWWEELFPGVFDPLWQDKSEVDARIAEVLAAGDSPGFTLIHLEEPDTAAHDHGADSSEHEGEVARAGRLVVDLLERLDPARDTLLVTADHGHLPRGGHGGPDPEVARVPLLAWGRGIHEGARGIHGALQDIAPTVALLLGSRPPRHALGRVLEELLSFPEDELQAALLAGREQGAILARAVPVPPMERRPSLAGLGVGLVFWASIAWLVWRLGRGPRPSPAGRLAVTLLVGSAFPVLYSLLYALTEPTFSFSAVFSRGPWIAYMTAYVVVTAALAITLQTLVARRVLGAFSPELGAASAAAAALPFFVFAGLHGSPWAGPELGDPTLSFGVLLSSSVGGVGCLVYGGVFSVRAFRTKSEGGSGASKVATRPSLHP